MQILEFLSIATFSTFNKPFFFLPAFHLASLKGSNRFAYSFQASYLLWWKHCYLSKKSDIPPSRCCCFWEQKKFAWKLKRIRFVFSILNIHSNSWMCFVKLVKAVFELQWKPLYVISSGWNETENFNRVITVS